MTAEAMIRAQYEVMTNGTTFGIRRWVGWPHFGFYSKYGEAGYYWFDTREEAEAKIDELVAHRLAGSTRWRPVEKT